MNNWYINTVPLTVEQHKRVIDYLNDFCKPTVPESYCWQGMKYGVSGNHNIFFSHAAYDKIMIHASNMIEIDFAQFEGYERAFRENRVIGRVYKSDMKGN